MGLIVTHYAQKTFAYNLCTTAVVEDVDRVLDPLGFIERHGLETVTGVIGGPPCQGFSRVGKGKMRHLNRLNGESSVDDPRNLQYKAFLNFVAKRELTSLLRNNRERGQAERFFFLPAALDIPNLVVDLQELATVSFAEAQGVTRIASIDSPFAELLATRFARYFGRLGVADLDTDAVIGKLAPPEDEAHRI